MSIGLVSLAAALRVWLKFVGPIPGDRYAATHYAPHRPEGVVLRRLTAFFSSLGTPLVAAGIIGVGLLALWLVADRRTARGLILACLVIPLNALLKLISGPTPLWTATFHAGDNFPSGHVAFVAAVVGYLGWVAARRHQPVGLVAALVVIVGMGPARVLVGAHLVSDVIGGYLVGGAVLVLAVAMGGRDAAYRSSRAARDPHILRRGSSRRIPVSLSDGRHPPSAQTAPNQQPAGERDAMQDVTREQTLWLAE